MLTTKTDSTRIKVRCLLSDQLSHVRPVETYLVDTAQFIYDAAWIPDNITLENTDIVLCVNEHHYNIAKCIERCHQRGIPTLTLQDGILEWRCQYQNPLFAAGGGAAQHQPVLADKIACIGTQSARHLASWGNGYKIEVTGMPRMDALFSCKDLAKEQDGRPRILIMTAKQPWFDHEQKKIIVRSLLDARDYFESLNTVDVIWRINKEAQNILGVENKLKTFSTIEINSVLDHVNAVICTPSTAIIESMLKNKPVAILDFTLSPQIITSPWIISDKTHFNIIVPDILNAPEIKMLHQRTCLYDALRCDGESAPRVAELIIKMVQHANQFRSIGLPINFPENMLGDNKIITASTLPPLAVLYPKHKIFNTNEINKLKTHASRLEKEYHTAKNELNKRSFSYWFSSFCNYVKRRTHL